MRHRARGASNARSPSHAQHLAVDTGIDHAAIRRALDELIDQRNRLRGIEKACPPSREYEINALAQRRLEIAEQDASARRELDALGSAHGWRHRRDRAARRLMLARQTNDSAMRLSRFDDAIERLLREHGQHASYLAEHEHELRQLPTIERAIDTRLEQLIDADVNNPPEYLQDLKRIPGDPNGVSRWRAAAHYIERHRAERGITDQRHPFGPMPDDNYAAVWHAETQQLKDLITEIDPPTPHLKRGIELA